MKPLFHLGGFRDDPAQDVRDELESHLELEVDALMAEGISEAEARAMAEAKMGPRRKIEAEASSFAVRLSRRRRLTNQLDTLAQDLGFALRTLGRAPLVTGLTILLLALGVGANTAIFSMLKGVVLDPLGLPRPEELVFVWETSPENPTGPVSFADFRDWREESRTLGAMGAYLARHVNLTDGEESVRIRGALTTSSLFEALGVMPAIGRPLTPRDDFSGLPVAVLDHGVWQTRYGGDPEVVGREIGLDGVPHTVVGVMPSGFQQPDPGSLEPIQVWVPLPAGTEYEPRRSRSYQLLGRSAPGASLQAVREELSQFAGRLADEYPEINGEVGVRVESAHQTLFGEAGRQLLLILGAAFLVLLVACGNIASLQLARAETRKGEMAVRAALGGSGWRVIRLLLTENALLALVGGGFGVLVAYSTLGLLKGVVPEELPRIQSVHLDGWVLLLALAVSILVGILFGLAPGLNAARVPVSAVLKEEHGREGRGSSRGWVLSAFLVGQLALSLILGNTALLLLRSYGALRGNELGFRTEDVLTMELSLRGSGYTIRQGRAEFYDELFPRLRGLPGVREVGAITSLPLELGGSASVVREEDWVEGGPAPTRTLELDRVAGDFFSALGIPLLSGRLFIRGEDDTGLGDYRAVLNQAAASVLWPGEDAVGRRFSHAGDEPGWITVVGVVGDTRNRSLGLGPLPQVYFPYASLPTGRMYLTIRSSGDPLELVPSVVREVRRVDPLQAVSQIRSLEGVVGGQLAGREFYTVLVSAFAGLALLLAAAGIFGGVSQFVATRRQEMGIRMALGSGEGELLELILGRAGRRAAWGLGWGVAGVFLSRRLLLGYLYGVGPLDPLTLLWGVGALLLVALLAALIPARRASRVDPVETLRRG